MVVATTRPRLDSLLQDPEVTLLLLFGGSSHGRALHDLAQHDAEQQGSPWRVPVLLRDFSLLGPAEITRWHAQDSCFTVLGGNPPQVAQRGPQADLLRRDGTPSLQALRRAFAAGDALRGREHGGAAR